jgi:hypothetical protein
MLQAESLRVFVPMRSLNFLSLPNTSSSTIWPWGYSATNRNEYLKTFLGGKTRPACKTDNQPAIYEPVV